MTLRIRELRVAIGERTLLQSLSLDVEPGTLTAVVGPNGAGKSTLLRALCGLHDAAGTLELDGTAITRVDPRARARAIAYLPQQNPSAPGLRVADVVMLGRLPHRSRLAGPSRRDRERAAASLDRVGMTAFADRHLHTLSGGERQRVMLARMLATEASVMLLDEPTAALDIRYALELLGTLRALAEDGRTVVLAIHDLPLADAFADRVICLPGDGTADVGTPADVLTPARIDAVFGAAFTRGDDGRLSLCLPATRG